MKHGVMRATVGVLVAGSLLAACSSAPPTGTSGLGQVTTGATAAGPTAAPAPTSTSTHTSKPGGNTATTTASPPVSASSAQPPKPSKGGGPRSFNGTSDYGVTVIDYCLWATNQVGYESLTATYTFHYAGILHSQQLEFVGQDNFGHNTYGYIGSTWYGSYGYQHDEGVNVDTAFSYSGQRVVLNVYLLPAVGNLVDDNAANNRAEVTIYVPNVTPPAPTDHAMKVNCVVDYGTSF
ncbi:MAG TPA: hypothetical protein VFR11_18000 [Micromonosporaceae bacterium]|jgi:hypothetical protein|nr:hypothetical protein [Micromonosporaceae bacterium]